MATVTNPDGTVSQFKIGEEESEVGNTLSEATAKAVAKDVTKPVKLNKDGTPRKKMGPKKKFLNERKVLSGYIDVNDHNMLLADFGSGTNAIVQLIEKYKQTKGN